MTADLDIVYSILRSWAIGGEPLSYTDLSTQYREKTGIWYEPHGSWDSTLGELNEALADAGAPAISALVIVHEKNEPGRGFWGSAANVPQRPKNEAERLTEWLKIIDQVKAFSWPEGIPTNSAGGVRSGRY